MFCKKITLGIISCLLIFIGFSYRVYGNEPSFNELSEVQSEQNMLGINDLDTNNISLDSPNNGISPDIDQFEVNVPDVEPQTQSEAITLLRNYIRQRFGNTIYSETQSTGDLELVIRQRFLFTNQDLEFILIPYHINQDFDFESAEYRWRVLQGDEEIYAVNEQNKQGFDFTFTDAGLYQVEVEVVSDQDSYRTNIPFSVYDKVELSVEPETPAAGDVITITPDYSGTDAVFQWKVDDVPVRGNLKELTFTEYKGVGAEYFIQLSVLSADASRTLSAGGLILEIPSPRIRMTMINQETEERIAITSQTIIEEPITILIQSEADYFNRNARLEYVYRVNGAVTPASEDGLILDIDPNKKYEIDVIVRDILAENALARRNLTINPQGEASNNQTEGIGSERSQSEIAERYIGLGIFISIIGLGIFVSKHGRLVS